jgi:signal transduction histidine kinase
MRSVAPWSFLGSLSLRLALLYALVLSGSVGALYGLAYWIAVHRPLTAVRATITQEASEAAGLYVLDGKEALTSALDQRAEHISHRKAYHLFIDPAGDVFTNLPSWPRRPVTGWRQIEADQYEDGEEHDHMALMLGRVLPDGSRLMLGRDVEDVNRFGEGLQRTAWSVFGATILISLGGGLLMSRAIGHRIKSISGTAERVLAGDLSGRVPLRGTGDDFDRLSELLNAMLARIEQLFDSVRRVSDNIAHELRTPLTRLRASMEEIPHAPLEERVGLLEEAIAEVDRLQTTFDALLRIARIESGRHQFQPTDVDISALLRDAVDFYAPEAEDRDLVLSVAVADRLRVRGDRDMLFQAVLNILDNGIKFSPRGGRLTVSAEDLDGPTIAIADTGPGIPAADRQRVFERFYRGEASFDVRGAGLGLALVAAVAELHGSKISLSSAEPGLRVVWEFPRLT